VSGVLKPATEAAGWSTIISSEFQRDIGRNLVFDIAYIGNTEHYINAKIGLQLCSAGPRLASYAIRRPGGGFATPPAASVGYLDMVVSGPATSD